MDVNRASSSSRATSPIRGSILSRVKIITHHTPEGDSINTKIVCPEPFATEIDQEQSTEGFRVQSRTYASFIAKLKAEAVNFVNFEFLSEKKFIPKGYKLQKEWYDQADISKVSFDGMRARGFSISGIILLEIAFQIRQNGYNDLVNKEILQTLKPDEKFVTRVKNIKNSFERIGYTLSIPCKNIIEELHLEPEKSLWDVLEERVKKRLEKKP